MLLVKVDHFKVVSKLHVNGCTFLPEYGLAHSRELFSDGNICIRKPGELRDLEVRGVKH